MSIVPSLIAVAGLLVLIGAGIASLAGSPLPLPVPVRVRPRKMRRGR